MTTLVSNPRTLTKEKLKNDLQRYNIPLPPSDSKKDVYVELYKTYLMKDRAEFSSDDESLSATPKRQKKPGSPRKASGKKASKKKAADIKREDEMEPVSVDISSLTDEELSSRLKEHGVDVGPILDTTRRVYERKLERLLHGVVHAEPVDVVDDNSQDEYSDNDEIQFKKEEPVQERVAPPPQQKKAPEMKRPDLRQRPQRTEPARAEPVQDHKDEVDSKTNNVPLPKKADNITTQAAPPATKKSSRGLSMWAQLGIILIVAVIIFFIIQNMEPAKTGKIGISGK